MQDNPIAVTDYTAPESRYLTGVLAGEGLLSSYLAPLVLLVLMAHLRRQNLRLCPGNFAHDQGYSSK